MIKKIIGAAVAGLLALGLVTAPAAAARHELKGQPPVGIAASKQSAARLLTGPYYFYNTGYQTVANTGIAAGLSVNDPGVDSGDHSLAEVMVKNASGDTIEFGWRKVNGDVPRLWAGHWEAGVFQGYNNADFIDYAGGVNLGDDLSAYVGTNRTFRIYLLGSDWVVSFNNTGVARIPNTSFSPTMTQASETQAYFEVASPTNAAPCTDMAKASPISGGVETSAQYYNTSGVLTNSSLTQIEASVPSAGSIHAYYQLNTVTARTFTAGGTGYC